MLPHLDLEDRKGFVPKMATPLFENGMEGFSDEEKRKLAEQSASSLGTD